MPNGNQPSLLDTSYTITADVEIPEARGLGLSAQGATEGVIVGEGGRFAGYALYLVKGKPVFTYNLLNVERSRWEGAETLAPGKGGEYAGCIACEELVLSHALLSR